VVRTHTIRLSSLWQAVHRILVQQLAYRDLQALRPLPGVTAVVFGEESLNLGFSRRASAAG